MTVFMPPFWAVMGLGPEGHHRAGLSKQDPKVLNLWFLVAVPKVANFSKPGGSDSRFCLWGAFEGIRLKSFQAKIGQSSQRLLIAF